MYMKTGGGTLSIHTPCTHMYIYIYIHIYIQRERERETEIDDL
jgi:hypothetical protein